MPELLDIAPVLGCQRPAPKALRGKSKVPESLSHD